MGVLELALVLGLQLLGLAVARLGGVNLLLHQLGTLLQHSIDLAKEHLAQDDVQHQQVDDGKDDGGKMELQHGRLPP